MEAREFNVKFTRFLKCCQVHDVPFAKKIIVTVVGFTVLLLGLVMIVTPGPAIVIIPAGLTILASEYSWARRWLKKLKKLGNQVIENTAKKSRVKRWWYEGKEFGVFLIRGIKKRLRHAFK
jgi:uncharacterized protein (TIGR02611 family)